MNYSTLETLQKLFRLLGPWWWIKNSRVFEADWVSSYNWYYV